MGLLEWLGESVDPRSAGEVSVGGRSRDERSRIVVLICFMIAGAALIAWAYVLWEVMELRSAQSFGIAVGATVLYLLVAYFVHPQADTDNLGWLGGLIDDPFHFSDDINRLLIFVMIALWPGRFIAESLVDAIRLLRHAGA